MARDTFIMTVDGVVEEHDRHLPAACPIRHGGVAPQLSDVEGIPMGLGGACCTRSRDTARCASCQAHSRAFFPARTQRGRSVR